MSDEQFTPGEVSRRPTVAVVGSSSVTESDEIYGVARRLGARLCERSFRIVTGGRGGVMEAVCRGVRESDAYFEGATVGILPGRDPTGANAYVDIAIPTGLNIGRNAIVAHADGLVAIGGGSGTLSEMSMAWQLGRPVVGLTVGGSSERLAGESIDDRVPPQGAGADDRVWAVDSAREAADKIEELLTDASARPRTFD